MSQNHHIARAARRLAGSACAQPVLAAASVRRRPASLSALLARQKSSGHRNWVSDIPLNPEMRFASFCREESNQRAFSVARQTAMQKDPPHNPLFIIANSGNGKSHLLQALVNRRRRLFPSQNALYVTGQALAGEHWFAQRGLQDDSFGEMLDELDLLVIDDIEGLAKADQAQKEIAALLARFLERGGVMVASARGPQGTFDLDKSLDRILRKAHLLTISTPEPALRLAALRAACAQAQRRGAKYAVERRAVEFIARELPVSIGALRNALEHLSAVGQARGKSADIPTAREVLAPLFQQAERRKHLTERRRGYFRR